MSYGTIGKWLLIAAGALAVIGVLFMLLQRFGVDRLPGDIVWRRNGLTVYIPLGLMILLSIILTILLNIFFRK